MAFAQESTGLQDYGPLDFLKGLRIFLDDLRAHPDLTDAGINVLFNDTVRLLSNRLRFQRDLQRHPEILDEHVVKPIIITGLPRTGTTKLQRVMSSDPMVQRLEAWRIQFPAPIDGGGGTQPDSRIAMTEQIEEMLKTQYPELMARHPLEVHEPDEEWFLLEMTFASSMSSIRVSAPNHRAWVEQRSPLDTYDYLRKLLQYLQWQAGSAACEGKPWILKTPAHLGNLPEVFETFPDALVVQCHRDPLEAIPSTVSFMKANRALYSDHLDLHALGDEFLDYFARQIARNLKARETLDPSRIVDVYFQDIQQQPLAVIREIYARAGRQITPAAEAAFTDWVARRPEGHFGSYRNEMEPYGLTRDRIESTFAEYIQRFPQMLAK